MLGIKELINRYRHNRGFGVQSPYAYHFVTSVLAEKYPYYAYPSVNRTAAKCGYKAARARLLFRIANYSRPQNILMYAPCEAVVSALTMARPSASASVFLDSNAKEVFQQVRPLGLLYVSEASDYVSQMLEQAINCTSSDSVIIVEGIHRSSEAKICWQKIKQNAAVAVTFDLYSMGIMFFDKSYKKQHYTLKM